MISRKRAAVVLFLLSICGELQAQGGPTSVAAEVHQQNLRLASTIADTRLAHSSASQDFRRSRRRLLASSQTAAQAENGAGVIEYRPVGFNIDGADFATFFTTAYANDHASGIRLGSGTYHVTPNIENGVHLYMRCGGERSDDFEVDFSGVFFYFTDWQFTGMQVTNCTNVNLHGPCEQTYTTDQLDFVQGTIVGVNDKDLEYTVEVDDAYPADRLMLHSDIATMLWHNDTLLLKGDESIDIIDAGQQYRKKLGDRKYLIKAKAYTPFITVGNLFSARGMSGTVGLEFDHSKNCSATDMTIYFSGGFGVFEPFSHNCSYLNIQIRPFPKSLGRDGKLPLISSNADGFHITNAHGGGFIKDSVIVNTGDDAIAIAGSYYQVAVVDSAAKSVVMATQDGEFSFSTGDLLAFYAADSERLGTARITKMYSVDMPKEVTGQISKIARGMKYDEADFMKVQLDAWTASMDRLQFDDAASSPSADGDGFAFTNNTIGNLRGRGILCKSSNGVIAHNRLFNLKGYAIQMAPEYLWGQADFVSNVLVLNNTVNSYGPGIWLGVDPAVSYGPPAAYTNNYNVDFINNTIANCATTPFLLTSAAGLSVINSTFVNVLCTESRYRNNGDWEPEGTLATVANVRDVFFSGNSVVNDAGCKHPHGNYDHPVAMVNATNVSGLVPRTPVSSLLQAAAP